MYLRFHSKLLLSNSKSIKFFMQIDEAYPKGTP